MNENIKLEDIEFFESSQSENEGEEDIRDVGALTFSDLAVTGTDWTVETIVNQIKKGNVQLDPSFQRRDAWDIKVKSRFIESLFLGLPIPQIILAEQKEKKGRFIVIDGKQRLLSLKQFVLPDNTEKPLRLSGLEIMEKINRKTYSDVQQNGFFDELDAFNNQTIRTVVIKNWKNVEVLYLLFLRLNTGSIKLSPQELRQALYPGDFISFVNEESSKNKNLQKVLNIKNVDFRMRDVEILIRYFAFYFYAKTYSGSMQNFLDTACDNLNKSFSSINPAICEALESFNTAIQLTYKIFSDKEAFRKYKNDKYEDRYNRAVIDIMLFYFSQVKQPNAITAHDRDIQTRFEKLCTVDQQFLLSLESTTKSTYAVHYRFRKWGECLSEITGVEFAIPEGY